MTDYERALVAVTRTLNHANATGADTTWAANAILTTLRGLGWRQTNAQPSPDWQHRNITPTEPTAEYLATRPPSRERRP